MSVKYSFGLWLKLALPFLVFWALGSLALVAAFQWMAHAQSLRQFEALAQTNAEFLRDMGQDGETFVTGLIDIEQLHDYDSDWEGQKADRKHPETSREGSGSPQGGREGSGSMAMTPFPANNDRP